MAIGPDDNLYVSIGDVDGSFKGIGTETKAQNYEDGPAPDGRAGILRITQNGIPVGEGILGNTAVLNLYYAYGIKNSLDLILTPLPGRCGILKMVLHLVTRLMSLSQDSIVDG